MTNPLSLDRRRKPRHRILIEFVAREPRVLFYSAIILIAGLLLGWWLLLPSSRPQPSRLVSPLVPLPIDDALAERTRRINFFESTVQANLLSTDNANRAAAQRCVARIERNFQVYRDGVDGFVNELTGIKSRFGILRRMPGEWWSGDNRVSHYITQKFESHIFSEARLTNDLRAALEAFRNDIRANQHELLSRTQAAAEESDLPPIKLDDYEAFFTVVNQQINELAGSEAKTSVAEGMVTLIAAEAGSTAVGMIAGRLIVGLTASTAATVAASGGATAGGAAAGAAGGSVFPGAGTVVGFGVGLVVGFGIDYWMNNQTALKLRAELLLYINQIESDLLLGPVVKTTDAVVPQGIRVGVTLACERLRDGVHERLYEIIVLEQSP